MMKQIVRPPLLQQDDKIAILAPARKIKTADVDLAIHTFSAWGLETVLSKNLFSEHHSYLSGSDQERLADLQTMLDDPRIKAIICARGGYGSTRIVDDLDISSVRQHPKWLVGFSDITAIHLKFFKEGIASIHGTMPVLFSRPDSVSSIESLKELLFNGKAHITFTPGSDFRSGAVEAVTMGGNLSLIADSLGTSLEPDTDGTILIIEEVDEPLYKIDRMMTQLKRAGKLKKLAALVVGHVTDCKDGEVSFGEQYQEIMMNKVKEYGYPVAFHFPSGHENPNLSWVNGGNASLLITDKTASLTLLP
jgi:muramoyltetrapeptide carboxypeptidase